MKNPLAARREIEVVGLARGPSGPAGAQPQQRASSSQQAPLTRPRHVPQSAGVIRVALLSSELSRASGWGTVTYELCEELLHCTDVSFRLLLPKNLPRDWDAPFSAAIRCVLPPWTRSFRGRPQRLLPFTFPPSRIPEADLIHAIVEFPYAILAWRLSRKMGVPFLVSTHGTYGVVPFSCWLDAPLYRQAFRRAAAITAPSRFTADAVRTASGLTRSIEIVHNPVNYARFQQPVNTDSVRQRLGIAQNAYLVLSVGALKMRKGFDILLRAFATVASQDASARLVIVGNGESGALAGLAHALGISSAVQLLGAVPEKELVGLYHACDVFALLPRNHRWNFEGFGIVYLEAGACGKPVVGTRSGGVAEAVRDGETGLLVPEEDVDAAAACLLRLRREPVLARALGTGGRKLAEAFHSTRFADRVVALYRHILGNPP